jgi:TolB-like protein
VRCAIEVQTEMVERNAGLPPERRIEFRIGIHLGDVVEESDGDLMGDGVNIAARLEGVAAPGAICLSEDAYRQVRSRLDLAISDLGETRLKNIAEPMRIYSLQVGLASPDQPTPGVPAEPSARLALPEKPSIAVLPFQNMSGDVEQDYFADGMVEDIITGLARIKWLLVTARNSSFAYKGKSVDIKQVGRELGVRYVLEGSVRKVSNRVRITGQLIEAETGGHVWADRYDRTLDDVFALQDELTMSVVAAIEPSLRQAEIERVKRKRPDNLDAYDLALRAIPLVYPAMPDGAEKALPMLEIALDIEPDYALAHGFAAWSHEILFARGGGHKENRLGAIRHAHAAIAHGRGRRHRTVTRRLLHWHGRARPRRGPPGLRGGAGAQPVMRAGLHAGQCRDGVCRRCRPGHRVGRARPAPEPVRSDELRPVAFDYPRPSLAW